MKKVNRMKPFSENGSKLNWSQVSPAENKLSERKAGLLVEQRDKEAREGRFISAHVSLGPRLYFYSKRCISKLRRPWLFTR